MEPQRRDFLKVGSLAAVSLAALWRAQRAGAQAKPLPRLDEKDPQAQALGYRNDARLVDRMKFPSYQPGVICEHCLHFEGRKSDDWAPCKIFPGKAVAANGWCSAFQRKKA
jgi:hypothetical protein